MKLSKIRISPFGVERAPSLLDKLACLLGYHQVVKEKRLSCQSDKVRCVKCQREFAINHTQRTVMKWDKDVERFYREYSNAFNNGEEY